MRGRYGFTLVELLVVIGIIGVLIVALVPIVRSAQDKAKETVVKTNLANIEASLANYAQTRGGNFPGVAVDVMAPYADHALGDPALYAVGGQTLAPSLGEMVNGVLGGFGYYNSTSTNVFEQLKNAKDTVLSGNENTARYFDSLVAADAVQEYPANPFVTNPSTGERARMRNIFVFSLYVGAGFDPINGFSPNDPNPGSTNYDCRLYVQRGGAGGSSASADTFDTTRVFLEQLPMGVPLSSSWTPAGFDQSCAFGVGKNGANNDNDDYFAPGDFAYVPVLSASAYPFGDAMATLEDENYKWGVSVTGYLLFGYGHRRHTNREFEDEQREFVNTGLPGYGAPGVDTIYENYVLQCFEGAIYFSKNI